MPAPITKRAFLKSLVVAGWTPQVVQGLHPASLPLADSNLVFLFQGDSITDGNRGRSADPNHSMGHGYAFAIASRIGADFPQNGFVFYNRGISGNTVDNLQKRWSDDTLALRPDVLSVLIGINDAAAAIENPADSMSLDAFETTYRALLTQNRQQHPDTLFVLGLPFVYSVGKRAETWARWRDETANRQTVVRKLANEFNAVLVDYPSLFDKAIGQKQMEYWVWDGIHPTVYAHELMAREWIRQVATRLNFLNVYRY